MQRTVMTIAKVQTPARPNTEANASGDSEGNRHSGSRTKVEMPLTSWPCISLGTKSCETVMANSDIVSPRTEIQATMPVKLHTREAALGSHSSWSPNVLLQAS
eukprot:Skav203889  [mRNA]  locus=scaffold1649:114405:114713:- [translate_table: standard]